jgi:hypothetical protein
MSNGAWPGYFGGAQHRLTSLSSHKGSHKLQCTKGEGRREQRYCLCIEPDTQRDIEPMLRTLKRKVEVGVINIKYDTVPRDKSGLGPLPSRCSNSSARERHGKELTRPPTVERSGWLPLLSA